MERHNITQTTYNLVGIPSSCQDKEGSYYRGYIQILDNLLLEENEETDEGIENSILRVREIFKDAEVKYKAPVTIPTIFRNNSERSTFLGLEHERRKIDPKNPPEEPFVIFTFADDIFANIVDNFAKAYPEGKQKPYLLHNKPAKIVCLRQEFSAEEAFEEVLSAHPPIYAEDIKSVKKSPYIDPDISRWKCKEGCMAEYSRIEDNEIQFIVDFSVIYPQDIWSTAYVLCYDCGRYAEVALSDTVKQAAKREIWHSIAQPKITKVMSKKGRCVIRLPMRNSLHTLCSFREGLIGFKPLAQNDKPLLYVRVRLTFYTNETSQIGHILHKRD